MKAGSTIGHDLVVGPFDTAAMEPGREGREHMSVRIGGRPASLRPQWSPAVKAGSTRGPLGVAGQLPRVPQWSPAVKAGSTPSAPAGRLAR